MTDFVRENRRELCLRCFRSVSTCFCSRIQPFWTRSSFVLLQHPLERKKSIGTARMAHLCLSNSRLFTGAGFEEHAAVNSILRDPKNLCQVLYPGPSSIDLEAEARRQNGEAADPPSSGLERVIFVIDGTWACAKNMLRASPNLAILPRVSFAPSKTSEYRIRRQPKPHCLSTIEAVHRVVEILEPSLDASNLLFVFREMVNEQLKFLAASPSRAVSRSTAREALLSRSSQA